MYLKRFKTLLFLIIATPVLAQTYTVNGKVSDDMGGLPGVSVIVKGTTTGTSTDGDGNYTISVENGNILEYSYVGYNTHSETMDGRTTINITLLAGMALDEVALVGSRNQNRTVADSAVPVDIINVEELISAGPQVNLNQILNYVAPSFTSNTQTISDGTDHIDPASLRGLGPDQVLVLINGKRRHNSSLINVNGTFGRGSVGTDLNAIPAAAISRIEVLRDGAAAQYGSDAIAGVINIVLKKNTNELKFSITTGAHISKNSNDQTGGMDGETTNISANYGLDLGSKGGFINFTGDFDVRNSYGRMKEWEGDIFNKYNTVERFANNAGYDLADLLDDDVADVITYATAAGFDLSGGTDKASLQTLLSDDNTAVELSARGMKRTDFNMRVGQSAVRGGRFFANLSLPLDEEGTELYSFVGLSSRSGNSAGFYRLPNQSRTYTPSTMNGFLPEINSDLTDKSFAVGIKGKVNDWDVDFSNTWGKNQFLFVIGNTSNASMQSSSPGTFDAGGFSFAQNTTNLDISKFYEDKMEGLNVAFGAEYRLETYEIMAGEEASYSQYTQEGDRITSDTQSATVDFFGRSRAGGAQVFPGFSPKNELLRSRNSIAGYFDIEADFTERFLVSAATRYENYSDFGSTLNFKLATRVKASDNMNIRAAFNTGFRAPSLHQLNFNSTSTVFVDAIPIEAGTFSNDSRAAQLLGIPKLKEETSQSVSLGFTAKIPSANLVVTIDAYQINIDDRIVYTGRFKGPGTGSELDGLLAQAGAASASFFANTIDTKSQGLDIVITHTAKLSDNVRLKSDLASTFSKTRRVGDINTSDILEAAGLTDTYFSEESRVFLENAVPSMKINLSNSLTTDKFNIFLRNVYFGEVTESTNTVANQQLFSAKIVTDLSFGYKISDSLTATIGANNLLDIYPDKAIDANRSSGRFDWSRRSQQFGIGGRFVFARLNISL
ncbi:MAG: TonB-dependent receptor [Flavobacteriaceae bacterium]|nr:TonB-dependent receptor [Flavobacteriaceae bacterium]